MANEWEDEYKLSVLEPARRAGNLLPQDPFVRYALTGGHRVPERFRARLDEVVSYWKKLATTTKVYKPLADALLAAHKDLARDEALTLEEFEQRRQRARDHAEARIDAWVKQVASGIPYLTQPALQHMVERSGGLVTEPQVRAKLALSGVTLIDPEWDLPVKPPVPTAANIPQQLNILGARLSPQVVFSPEKLAAGFRIKDGFRLTGGSGDRLTHDGLEAAKTAQAQRPYDLRKTAAESVLTTMLAAARAGTLDQLVRWEVAEIIRRALRSGLPPSVAAEIGMELGLDRTEALELAVTLGHGGGPPPHSMDARAAVDAALSAGSLREAEQLLASLPADAGSRDVRERVRKAVADVASLVASADDAERAGCPEQAARFLADAARRAVDDHDLAARLDRIPPPPPAGVRAGIDAGRITVRWTPSGAATGQITYRVVRRVGTAAVTPGDGEQIAETAANHATDAAPPVAEAVVYTVFAVRGATASSGAATAPLTLLPEISGYELSADGRSVTGTWQLSSAAVEVVVTRTRTDTDGDGNATRIPTVHGPATGFADTTAEIGAGYSYAVQPIYLSRTGERRPGPAVAESTIMERPPLAVTDLAAKLLSEEDTSKLRLTFTVPPGGRVEIRRASAPPPWAVDSSVPASAVNGYGEVVGVTTRPAEDGRAELLVPAGQGRTVLTAFSRGRSQTVVGGSVTLELTAVVTGLRARRRWDSILVDWLWPDGVHEARVRWSTAAGGDQIEITRRAFQDGGGLRLDTGPAAVMISVETVVRERHTTLVSAPVVTEVVARPPRVEWRLHRSWCSRRMYLRLRADQSCQVPELKLSVRGGIRVPGRWVTAGEVANVRVGASVPAGSVDAIDCTLADTTTATVVLAKWSGR
jgi:hypothetical protein